MSAPARVRQADMVRALKAAALSGLRVSDVVFRPDGTVIVRTVDASPQDEATLPPVKDCEGLEWDEAVQ